MIRRIKKGDTLVIKSIDRLSRNYDEIIEQRRIITKEIQADIVLQLLSYVAQTEREYIRQRQAEGIALARARGVRFGPKPMQRPETGEQLCTQWERGHLSAREAARLLHISHNTFLRWAREKTEAAPSAQI